MSWLDKKISDDWKVRDILAMAAIFVVGTFAVLMTAAITMNLVAWLGWGHFK